MYDMSVRVSTVLCDFVCNLVFIGKKEVTGSLQTKCIFFSLAPKKQMVKDLSDGISPISPTRLVEL